jgi:hypothetical protein
MLKIQHSPAAKRETFAHGARANQTFERKLRLRDISLAPQFQEIVHLDNPKTKWLWHSEREREHRMSQEKIKK